jgi:hypothetical protein
MSKGVFTRMKRFQFVEKTAGEVGDGTIYSAQVTVAQIEELFYRVRDSKFTAGRVKIIGTLLSPDEVPGSYEVTATGYEPPTTLADGGSGDLRDPSDPEGTPWLDLFESQRAYCIRMDEEARPPAIADFYDYFSNPYSLTAPHIPETQLFYDLNHERGMWIPGSSDYVFGFQMEATETSLNETGYVAGFTGSNYNEAEDQALADLTMPGFNVSVFRECTTGFSARFLSYGIGSTSYYGFNPAFEPNGHYAQFVGVLVSGLSFSKQVAWVNVDGSGDPFSAGNTLYLPVYFSISGDESGIRIESGLSVYLQGGDLSESTVCNLVLSMVSGEITVPLYVTSSFFDTIDEIESDDFTVEATEWWPYAKGSPAEPVWDSETGMPWLPPP